MILKLILLSLCSCWGGMISMGAILALCHAAKQGDRLNNLAGQALGVSAKPVAMQLLPESVATRNPPSISAAWLARTPEQSGKRELSTAMSRDLATASPHRQAGSYLKPECGGVVRLLVLNPGMMV